VIGQVITTAIVGAAILRDVQIKAHELLFTTRVTRLGYLGGRFTGAVLTMIVIYAALPLGAMAGTIGLWVDHTTLEPFQLATYARPFFLIVVPDVLIVSALFPIVNPLGGSPIYLALTRNYSAPARRARRRTVLVGLDTDRDAGVPGGSDHPGANGFGQAHGWPVSRRSRDGIYGG